ncbi:hypothetical protein Pan153_07830 [Gimesia panareensis]|uniref:Uncharacterized protein n=1 Tax=Gimesia panareensis TaxID=2527978 RepID=A0A517Q4I9_9PLAN|nr:hypothetical protein [Gimesia panareensis]QDT26553.1 hypothetical protein Enr10x_18570 [Gimesia panareensis]QDV16162.1 hypothetical protein Pan153_07830 [Gimesia panareensis]
MDVWNLILYVVASLLALKSLASLMSHHKKVVVQQLAIEYTQEMTPQGKKAAPDQMPDPQADLSPADQNASAA